MTPEDFKKLKKRATEDIQFNEDNAVQMSALVPNLYQKYLSLYISELEKYKILLLKRDRMYGQLLKKEKLEGEIEWRSKDEYNSVIICNDDYYNLKLKAQEQEYIVKFLEETLENIKRLSFNIKNYVDLKKFLGGLS